MDQIDSYLKGGFEYILEIGALNIAFSISIFLSAFVGIKSENVRFHNFVSALFFSWQLLIVLQIYDMLAL